MKSTENLYGNSPHAQQHERGSFKNEPFATETCLFAKLGQMDYVKAWDVQRAIARRREHCSIPDSLILLEHPHTYTLGRRGKIADVLVREATLKQMGVQICYVDRGGQVTYHGPGQLVGYPILDLHNYQISVSWYMRSLEGVIINCLKQLGIKSARKEDLPGVWVDDNKICAMGVRMSRWVTMHGFALNLAPDMNYFDGMIPCGIFNYGVTSIHDQGININMGRLVEHICVSFSSLFEKKNDEV